MYSSLPVKTMKRINFVVCLSYTLLVFKNEYVSSDCISCTAIDSGSAIQANLTAVRVLVPDSSKPNSTMEIWFYKTPSKTKSSNAISKRNDIVKEANNKINNNKTIAEDVLTLFSSNTSWTKLSFSEKNSATLKLISCYDSLDSRLPDVVAVSLITMYANTKELFTSLSPQQMNTMLILLTTTNKCALHKNITSDVHARFLNELLSVRPAFLNGIPKSVFVCVLGTVTSTDVFDGLSETAVMNLITVFSFSKSLLNCLPLPTLIPFLTYASATSVEWSKFPSTTLFRFFEALFDTLIDSSPTLMDYLPNSVVLAIINDTRVMTTRILSVSPVRNIDVLLSYLISSPKILIKLPVTNIVSLLNVLKSSPNILSVMNASNLGALLTFIRTCPLILKQLPQKLYDDVLASIALYLPLTFECIN